MSIARLAICAAFFFTAWAAPASAAMRFDDLPERTRTDLFDLSRVCSVIGGRPGDAMASIEFFDFDEDGTPDIIFDEGRFPCAGVRREAWCPPIGCSTFVTLSQRGRWRPAFDVVGSYCIDRESRPARFVTIQRTFTPDGKPSVFNVRYRFRKGMAFQEGLGTC